MLEDRDGVLWVGTYGGGLGRWIDGTVSRLDRSGGQWTSNNVWTLFEDREGTLWAGTLGGGLNQLKDGPFTTYSVDEGMASEIITSLHEDPQGDLWIATRGGVHRFRDGPLELLTADSGLTSNNLWAVFGDRQENLWFGHSAGVDRLSPAGDRYHLGVDDGLADPTVFAFLGRSARGSLDRNKRRPQPPARRRLDDLHGRGWARRQPDPFTAGRSNRPVVGRYNSRPEQVR